MAAAESENVEMPIQEGVRRSAEWLEPSQLHLLGPQCERSAANALAVTAQIPDDAGAPAGQAG